MSDLTDLFRDQLRDMYGTEVRFAATLPRAARAAADPALRARLEQMATEAANQSRRVGEAWQRLGWGSVPDGGGSAGGPDRDLDAAAGAADGTRDAGLIAAAQQVAHHRIARYGALCSYAMQFGLTHAAGLLHRTLDEAKAADRALTGLAERGINRAAVGAPEAHESPDGPRPDVRRSAGCRGGCSKSAPGSGRCHGRTGGGRGAGQRRRHGDR